MVAVRVNGTPTSILPDASTEPVRSNFGAITVSVLSLMVAVR